MYELNTSVRKQMEDAVTPLQKALQAKGFSCSFSLHEGRPGMGYSPTVNMRIERSSRKHWAYNLRIECDYKTGQPTVIPMRCRGKRTVVFRKLDIERTVNRINDDLVADVESEIQADKEEQVRYAWYEQAIKDFKGYDLGPLEGDVRPHASPLSRFHKLHAGFQTMHTPGNYCFQLPPQMNMKAGQVKALVNFLKEVLPNIKS